MSDCPPSYFELYNLPQSEIINGRTAACHVDSQSYLMKNWHPRFDSALQSWLRLHNDKMHRHEKLAGELLNLLAAAVGLSPVKGGMKIYEVGKCPVIRATFSFSLSRNIGTFLVETLCCAYCRVRDQLASQQNIQLQICRILRAWLVSRV